MKRENFDRAMEVIREIEELERDIESLYKMNSERQGKIVIMGNGVPGIPLLDRDDNSDRIDKLIDDAITEKTRQKEDLENELKQL